MLFPTVLSLSVLGLALAAPHASRSRHSRGSNPHKRLAARAASLQQSQQEEVHEFAKRCSNDSSVVQFDDADADISWTGQWTHGDWFTDAAHHGTLSFSKTAGAGYNFTTPKGASSFAIYSSLKADRGSFNVLVDGQLVGNGSLHSPNALIQSATKSVFTHALANPAKKHTISVVNTASAQNPYIALDYVELTGANITAPAGGNVTGTGTGTGTGSGGNATTGSITGYFAGANSYYIHALADSDRIEVLDAMKSAGFKTIRIFISQVQANNKGSNNQALNDLEPNQVGTYDDTVLEKIDQLMVDASSRGMKLIIALGDRYSLGFWETDAYAIKFGIVASGSSGAQQVANAATFYTDSTAISAYENRIAHIMQHKNAKMGNKQWSQLSEAIYAFEPQNEPQGHMDMVSSSWVCDRATTIKKYTSGSGILNSSGGGITLQDSLESWAMDCDAIDVVCAHDYGTDAQSTVATLKQAQQQLQPKGKIVLFEEWGASGTSKSSTVGSFVQALKAAGVPWMYWEVMNPGKAEADFEVWTNEESWNQLTQGTGASSSGSGSGSGSKAKRSSAGATRRSQSSKRNPSPTAARRSPAAGLGLAVVDAPSV